MLPLVSLYLLNLAIVWCCVSILFICFFAFFLAAILFLSRSSCFPPSFCLPNCPSLHCPFSFPSSTLRVNLDPSKRQSSNKSVSGCTLPQGSKTVSKFSSCLWPFSISQSVNILIVSPLFLAPVLALGVRAPP